MGMLFSPNELPTPSCGTPSMKILTCFPLNPSSVMAVLDPTPPDSRTFTPGTLASVPARSRVVLCSPLASMATAL